MSVPEPQPADANGVPYPTPDTTALLPAVEPEPAAESAPAPDVDYVADLQAIVADLDDVIHRLGNDLSVAVVSDFKHERIAGVSLRLALEALKGARDVVASTDPTGGPVGVKEGV